MKLSNSITFHRAKRGSLFSLRSLSTNSRYVNFDSTSTGCWLNLIACFNATFDASYRQLWFTNSSSIHKAKKYDRIQLLEDVTLTAFAVITRKERKRGKDITEDHPDSKEEIPRRFLLAKFSFSSILRHGCPSDRETGAANRNNSEEWPRAIIRRYRRNAGRITIVNLAGFTSGAFLRL